MCVFFPANASSLHVLLIFSSLFHLQRVLSELVVLSSDSRTEVSVFRGKVTVATRRPALTLKFRLYRFGIVQSIPSSLVLLGVDKDSQRINGKFASTRRSSAFMIRSRHEGGSEMEEPRTILKEGRE